MGQHIDAERAGPLITSWARTLRFTQISRRGGSAVIEHTAVAVSPALSLSLPLAITTQAPARWRMPLQKSAVATVGAITDGVPLD
jgi:hypothetical protein